MKVCAVYNLKGGVGKTTAAVNLSYLAARDGLRVLIWDLDPQAAATFAFRIRAHVEGFGKKSLEDADSLRAAIRETDHANLDLLPADFAYRKLDRFLDRLGKPRRVMTSLLETLGRDYDVVFLDCPAGFSLLTEGILAAADAILMPAIPTLFSLRTVAQLVQRADRAEAPASLSVFFNMVDRRKAMHRLACQWSAECPSVFLTTHVPYASIVEQMATRRMPLATFAARDVATEAFAQLWTQVQTRDTNGSWAERLQAVESLMTRMASLADEPTPVRAQVVDFHERRPQVGSAIVHRFDTAQRDLERRGLKLELSEQDGSLRVAIVDGTTRTQVEVDRSWAFEILSGALSPLTAMERRLGRRGTAVLDSALAIVNCQPLQRVESRSEEQQQIPADVRRSMAG